MTRACTTGGRGFRGRRVEGRGAEIEEKRVSGVILNTQTSEMVNSIDDLCCVMGADE